MCHYPNILWVTLNKRKSSKGKLSPTSLPATSVQNRNTAHSEHQSSSLHFSPKPKVVSLKPPFPRLASHCSKQTLLESGKLQATHTPEQKMGIEFREDAPVAAQHICTVAAGASEAGSGLGGLRVTQLERCAAGKASVVPPTWIIHRASALSFRKEDPSL